ncbi:MAG: nicotinamide riboside transporter PnuC [Weeksellaceae bacterium]
MTDFFSLLIEPYRTYETWMIVLEIIAVILGILSVFFSLNRNIWVYPVGIISTGIYVYLLFVFGLLGDCLINVYYTAMSIYGWTLWSKNSPDKIHVNVSWANSKEWFFGSLLFLGSLILVILVYYFKPWLDNDFVLNSADLGLDHLDWANWLDVFTTSIFLIGMWLMAKQKIENWLFWILGDLVCIPMFIYKGLVITSIQFFVFTVLAVIAYFEWKKNYLETQSKSIQIGD